MTLILILVLHFLPPRGTLTVMTVVPTFLGVTTPLRLTLATFFFEDLNLTPVTVAVAGMATGVSTKGTPLEAT